MTEKTISYIGTFVSKEESTNIKG